MIMAAELPPFPFDRVVVADPTGSSRDLTPSEFFALPLAERIQYVVQQKASFFFGDRKIDSRDALAQLRRLRAQVH